ncbi:MAG: sigma-70 family RNA polymerase sigma factor [Actinobacteria bacterium]|nr:sigma-70 family RNA polymerase sigma factor [Actinomycetota bacterium]
MRRRSRAALENLGDDHLIERARSGDALAAAEILRRYQPQVRRVCRQVCRSPHDAEDAAQDALASINVGLRTFDGRSSLSTWIHRIATNRALDELRRRSRRPVPVEDAAESMVDERRVDPGAGPERTSEDQETRTELITALGQLPEALAEAVVLRDVADLDYATIAAELGVPVGTVRSRIARGRSRLAEVLRNTPGWNHPGSAFVPHPGANLLPEPDDTPA